MANCVKSEFMLTWVHESISEFTVSKAVNKGLGKEKKK